jgi:hypothetical protein
LLLAVRKRSRLDIGALFQADDLKHFVNACALRGAPRPKIDLQTPGCPPIPKDIFEDGIIIMGAG